MYYPKWSRDGHKIFALRKLGAYKQLYTLDKRIGKLKQITHGPLDIRTYALSPDGSTIAWIGQNAHGYLVMQIAKEDGSDLRDLWVTPSVSDETALGEVREIEWNTIHYPSPMRGLLFLPINYQAGKHYPLIVDIHGGDIGAHLYLSGGILVSTPLEWQMWAAKGYAVFVPEFRSSGAFGSLAIKRDQCQYYDLINRDVLDIETGVDYLIQKGIANPHRLYAIGHSAGCIRASWLGVTSHRYKAIVSKEGWTDQLIISLNEPSSKCVEFFYGGSPQKVPQHYLKNSALSHSSEATTPILFFAGNTALSGADLHNTLQMLHQVLKKKGIKTEFVYYADEGHVFSHLQNKHDCLERIIKWFK